MLSTRIAFLLACLLPVLFAADRYDVTGRVTGLGPGEHATVKLLGPSSHQVTTSADGTWRLGNAPAGTYRVSATHAGYRFTPEYRTVVLRSRDVHDINFVAHAAAGTAGKTAATGAAPAEKYQITGRVSGLGANHHATIRAVGARSYSTTTRSDGTWTIPNAVSGDYNVNATHSLYTFSPAFHHAAARTNDVHNVNFTAHPKAGGGSSKKK
jgi:hypothetical protein